MIWIIVSGILGIILLITSIKLQKKQKIDRKELNKYIKDVAVLEHKKENLITELEKYKDQIAREQQHFEKVQQEYGERLAEQERNIYYIYEKNKAQRMEQLDNEIQTQKEKSCQLLQKELDEEKNKYNQLIQNLQQSWIETSTNCDNKIKQLKEDTKFQQERFNNLLAPLQQYERAQQEKLYYTIQVPEEYHNDIDYLLTTVSQKVNHPDIISKLVWAEYVKPYMDDTIKRVEIKEESGIYKITNINNDKCYIGKSTNVKKRLQDHFKSSVGINSIADQAIHHAILNDGLWNWMIEVISYCDKDKLNELEKYYIEFFKAQEYGYNKTGGG